MPDFVQKFNFISWSVGISSFIEKDKTLLLLTDLDAVCINLQLAKPKTQRKNIIVLQHFVVDIENMIAYHFGSKNEMAIFYVQLTEQNDRSRSRISQRKTNSKDLVIDTKSNDGFAKDFNEYGKLWEEFHNGWNRKEYEEDGIENLKLPSANQVLDGLEKFFEHLLSKQIDSSSSHALKQMNESYKAGFNKIREIIDFPDFDKPFERIRKGEYNTLTKEYDDFNSPYNLFNSKSKASFLLLHIYSMEPPFYFHLNTACRNKDFNLITMLGPFADALYWVVAKAEY